MEERKYSGVAKALSVCHLALKDNTQLVVKKTSCCWKTVLKHKRIILSKMDIRTAMNLSFVALLPSPLLFLEKVLCKTKKGN